MNLLQQDIELEEVQELLQRIQCRNYWWPCAGISVELINFAFRTRVIILLNAILKSL